MNDKKKPKRNRPLSHNPLLKFKHDDNFLYDKKFMNDELWQEKYNLRNLREKWKQKVQTNFLKMDIKFGTSSKNIHKNRVIYHDTVNKKDLYLIPNSMSLFPYLNKVKSNKSFVLKNQDKYNDKISYYLSNKNPWNKQTSLEVNKNDSSKNINVHEKLQKELSIRNKIKNSNEAKNISVKCIYYNIKYLQKKEKLQEIMDKYMEDMDQFVLKKYAKEIKIKKHGKKLFIKLLILKELFNRYLILYDEIISKSEKNIFNNQILYRNNSDINLINSKNTIKSGIKNIYEELYIIIKYIKENKNILNDLKGKKYLVQKYFDVIEKDEILQDKDLNYIKFIKNFGINNNLNSNISNSKNILISRKKNASCLNLCDNLPSKRKFSEYNITYYHPGTYYLFKTGEEEYHAWSCCMNDDLKAKGCCKKTERIPYFNYDIIG